MRDQIISEIRRLADENGKAPGQRLFESETGIAAHIWLGKIWARWGDALTDAGFEPNEWQGKRDSDEILEGLIGAIRHYGHFPSNAELTFYRQSEPSVPHVKAVRRHFGHRHQLLAVLEKRCEEDSAYSDVLPLLPKIEATTAAPDEPTVRDGHVYLIKSGDFYKVGRSDELERRVKEIRLALPEAATLIHSIATDDPPGIEAYWHRRFADERANGEWFKLAPSDVKAFRKRRFQ